MTCARLYLPQFDKVHDLTHCAYTHTRSQDAVDDSGVLASDDDGDLLDISDDYS